MDRPNMRVLYDGSIYAFQTVGGINRYFANIIKNLPPKFEPILTTRINHKLNYPKHPALKVFSFPFFHPKIISGPLGELYFIAIEQLTKPDVIHPTYYFRLTGKSMSSRRCPLVLTVHDMIHEIYSDTMDHDGLIAHQKKEAILGSDAIICISENTKMDLMNRVKLPEDKITVIHSASEIDISISYGDEPIPDEPYFLHVGARGLYKNFYGLCIALAKIAKTKKKTQLCVVGPPFNSEELKTIVDLNLMNRIQYYGNVTDSHLAKLYRCSIAFVYPSLYEGFGIPLLEAMSCGTVVIGANASSIPEVVGDAAILFEPSDKDSLYESLSFVLKHPENRSHFISRGYERAKNFSWEKTVEKTAQVYRSLL
jgi:glycosyltransferase involved in cell wall biosynthesis